MKKNAYNVAIAGATGAVGEMMIKVLAERKFPVADMRFLASERSVGKTLAWNGKDIKVELLSKKSFKGIDVALFSAGADRSKEFASSAADAGAVVVDNSSAFRMDEDVPLVVPEVNPADVGMYKKRGIVANPNCTTIVTIVPLKPLYDISRITRMIVSSYQSASGAGAQAIAELEDQVAAHVHGKAMVVKKFAHQIAFNVIPHIDSFLDNGYTREEMKMVNETRKIFHDDNIMVSATTVRVPVLTAHSVAVWLEFEKPMSPQTVRKALKNAPGVKLVDDPGKNLYPMPKDAAGQDLCLVGRIREDITNPGGIVLWVSGDQLRKGAATNAVQIAEILIDKYL